VQRGTISNGIDLARMGSDGRLWVIAVCFSLATCYLTCVVCVCPPGAFVLCKSQLA
jgi:hypothetical protein